jgi:signal transduction histidine kinase
MFALARPWPTVALTLLAWALAALPAYAREPARTVLTIHSGAADYGGNPVLDAGIQEALFRNRGEAIDYFAEYLDFDRLSEIEPSPVLGDYISRKYAGRRFDVVIAMTSRSLRFVVENRAKLFPTASIVFGAADDSLVSRAGPDITGVRFSNHYSATLKLALELHPAAREAFVVAISPNPQVGASVRAELGRFDQQVTLTYLEADSLTGLLDAVRAVPRSSVILFITFQRAGESYVTDLLTPARLVAGAARVPVYSVVDTMIGTGVVGGKVREMRASGTRAGEMARRILGGTPARQIPIENVPLVPMFDWRQLQRWDVDPSRLPPGSDIRFRVPTVWEAHRRYIAGAIIIMAVQLFLIAGLVVHRARRQRAEETLRAREATLRKSYVRIRQLAGRLITVQETARANIARDLHDDVCQELVGVSMAISALKRSSASIGEARRQRALAQLERSARNTVDSVRRLSHDLHPASLRLLGLAAALRGHCLEVEKRHGVHVSFSGTRDVSDLPIEVAVCLFRIAQEALRNGIVHGSARQLAVSLARTDGQVELQVSDDGRGFDLEAVRRGGDGIGLVSIEERAHAVGATAQITTRVAHGTSVVVRAPIAAGDSADDAGVPEPVIAARLMRAVHPLHAEVRRVGGVLDGSRRTVTGTARDDAAGIGARRAAGHQSKGHL